MSFEPAEGSVVVDLDRIIASKLLIQASSGGGKSYMLRYVLEQTHGKVQQIIIDHDGEFGSLRERFDYILVGKDGDIPTDPKTAKLLARRLMELRASAVIDLYDLQLSERKEFVKRFLDELMHLPRTLWHPLLVVIDECHVYCPEKGHGEAVSSSAVIDLATNGRKRGFALCAATQRLSKFNKDAAADLLNKLIGMTGLDVDIKRAGDELGFTKEGREALKWLEPGQFYAYGPAISRAVTKVHSGEIQTTHPRPGVIAPPKPPAPEKVQKLVGELGDLAAKSAEEVRDFETAQKRIRELEGEIRRTRKATEESDPAAIRTAVDAATAPLLNKIDQLERTFKEAAEVTRMIIGAHESLFNFEQRLGSIFHLEGFVASEAIKTAEIERTGEALLSRPPFEPDNRGGPTAKKNDGVTASQQKVLNAVAWFEAFGIDQPTRLQAAVIAGYRPGSGNYNNLISGLKTQGLLRYPGSGTLSLTDEGRDAAEFPQSAGKLDDLHSAVRRILNPSQVKVLQPVLDAYPSGISREEVASACSYQAGSGNFNNLISSLKTLGLIDYPSKGAVRATPFLFPEGLK